MSGQQGSELVSNGQPTTPFPASQMHTPPSPSTQHEYYEDRVLEENPEPPVIQIERDLDELTFSGAAINDLEVQLTRTKRLYQQVLVEGKSRVDELRRKLHTHIVKSEPFIEVWRKARQVQEMSNKAAARYDKANSQHLAAKEMIRVAESQLADSRAEQKALEEEEPSSPSPLDLAWQEMLNHATSKVVLTEKERRDSELNHRRVLEECKKIMDDYRAVERKLRTHIVKSRPYFQERYRINQQLVKLKETMKSFEQKINESKQAYSASLKRLEVLNTEMHERRGTHSGVMRGGRLDPRQILSAGSTPDLKRVSRGIDSTDDLRSVDSMCMAVGYSGSTGSLPSIGVLSNTQSPSSDSDCKSLELDNVQSNSPTNRDYESCDDKIHSDSRASPLNSDESVLPRVESSETNLLKSHEYFNANENIPNPDVIPAPVSGEAPTFDTPDETNPGETKTPDTDSADTSSVKTAPSPDTTADTSSVKTLPSPDTNSELSADKDPEGTEHSPSLPVGQSSSQVQLDTEDSEEQLLDCVSEEQLSQVAGDLVVRCLVSATNMVQQESKSTLT